MPESTQQQTDSLFRWVKRKRFRRWAHSRAGRVAKAEVIRRARRLQATGFDKYGIAGIWEAMRYDRGIEIGPGEDGHKLNNDWRSFLAREIAGECDDLNTFFTSRARKGDPDNDHNLSST